MEASGDALEEFLIRFPRGGEDHFVVLAKTANEAIAGDVGAKGAWIDVGARDVFWAPGLTGDIARLGGPILRGHALKLAIEKKEALREIILGIAGGGFRETEEFAEADAGLSPMDLARSVAWIFGRQLEADFVRGGRDRVIHRDLVREHVADADAIGLR